jgi:hypothetical protein
MGTGWSHEDWDGEPGGDWNNTWHDKQGAWLDRWAPKCPRRNPQRVGRLLGYREREPGRLQLRVATRRRTDGVCEALVEESEATVHVLVLLCFQDREESWGDGEYWDCPVHVYLEKPLGARTVIAVEGMKPCRYTRHDGRSSTTDVLSEKIGADDRLTDARQAQYWLMTRHRCLTAGA